MRYSRRFLGTVCVPWHDDDTVDVPTFRASIRTLVTAGMRDLYIFGTAGEGHAVTDEQFRQVTNVFVDEYLEDPRFAETVKDIFAEALLLRAQLTQSMLAYRGPLLMLGSNSPRMRSIGQSCAAKRREPVICWLRIVRGA